MTRSRCFRTRLNAKPTVGIVLQSASPLVASSMSAAGFDWLVIDPINSPLSQPAAFAMQTAIGDASSTPVLMRVGGPADRSGIQQATDTGAAGILVPNVRSVEDIAGARRPTRFPPIGDRSLFGPVPAHHKQGMVVHLLRADSDFVVAIQLEKAPPESWEQLLQLDFHVAVLDVPQMCVELGLCDALLADPPAGDGSLAARLEPWLRVYQQPAPELTRLVQRFAVLCRKHRKVAGVLLGDHRAAALYQSLGIRFIGIGSDLMVMMERAVAAMTELRANAPHGWSPAPLDCAGERRRSEAFLGALRTRSPLVGAILADGSDEAIRSVRDSPLVLIDTLRADFATPGALDRALRSLDGNGHRLVRSVSADARDSPMTAAVALALGADSVVVPVSSVEEARAVKAACSYEGSRALNIGPELPWQLARSAAAGIELLAVPVAGIAELIEPADFVMASTGNLLLAEGGERAPGSIAWLQQACAEAGKPFLLLDDARLAEDAPADWLHAFAQRIAPPPTCPTGRDEHAAARNSRVAEFKHALRRGRKSIGQVVCSASPVVAAAYLASGVEWIWIEWQHSCQDIVGLRAQVSAIAQRGGFSIARTAGAHDRTGIQQCLDAGVDFVMIPYINGVEDAREAIRHCRFAPRGDRVWNGSERSRMQQTTVMFQAETSACIDALEEILREPELEFCFIGPGDLGMSMGLRTRDSILRFLAADELDWCFRFVQEACTRTGKIAGAFARDGHPSSLLVQGYAMAPLSSDIQDAMTGAQSILTGKVRLGGATVRTMPGLTELRKWKRRASRLIPTAGILLTEVIPAILAHLWSVRGWRASPTLALPKAMSPDARSNVRAVATEGGHPERLPDDAR